MTLQNLLTTIYNHPDSKPASTREAQPTGSNPEQPEGRRISLPAQPEMAAWAITLVQARVLKEAADLANRTVGLRLPADRHDWEYIMHFSLQVIQNCIQLTAPTLYSLVVNVATSPNALSTTDNPANGTIQTRRRDPQMIATVVILMLIVTRNMRANFFQKIIGIWLFACAAPQHTYHVLSHLGLSVSYSTVFQSLRQLSKHSIETTRQIAKRLRFLLIFDNINRQRKYWNPSVGQQDQMMSGTAATLVELADFEQGAFDPKPVLEAQSKRLRLALTTDTLMDRIDHEHLNSVMGLHCLNFLISNCPALSSRSGFVATELRTTRAIHRMPDNHKTTTHPLSTSSINEGSAAGCREVLDDLLLRQLQLPPALVNSILIIIGGDLGTIEKIRALKTLEASCLHGYPRFSWVLPLVQLWHMGWADLARIVNTHWGKSASFDPSSLWHNAGVLASKVKPGARPEYYPALALVFDTLEADVLDCWRLLLNTDDLDRHFTSMEELPSNSQLLELADTIVSRWASTHAHNVALHSEVHWEGPVALDNRFAGEDTDSDTPLAKRSRTGSARDNRPARAKPQKRTTMQSNSQADHCLANSILRLRDSLWHLEFNWAVADGDIGRVMQVMSIWQFTFTGSKASKYSAELLELACGFLYEFPPALQNALKNNWLCNLSGLPGCWFPMDLMQEHNIRELKNKSQRRDEDFDGDFFRNVVSRNVRWFTKVRAVVNDAVNLQDRSSAHRAKKREGTANQLRASLEQEQVHTFVPSRTYGWLANDNFVDGIELMPAKIARFLSRDHNSHSVNIPSTDSQSTVDPIDDLGDAIEAPDDPEPPELPVPAMIIAGQFVPGDAEDDITVDGSPFDVFEGVPDEF